MKCLPALLLALLLGCTEPASVPNVQFKVAYYNMVGIKVRERVMTLPADSRVLKGRYVYSNVNHGEIGVSAPWGWLVTLEKIE